MPRLTSGDINISEPIGSILSVDWLELVNSDTCVRRKF
jgi:hypothetical protein